MLSAFIRTCEPAGRQKKLTGLLEPICEFMPVTRDPAPCLREQGAIVDEFAKSVREAAGVGVVEAAEDERRDMHVDCWSGAKSMLRVLLGKG